MQVKINKVVIKFLQGSVVTHTVLGGLTIYPQVVNFLQCSCTKNYESWLEVIQFIFSQAHCTKYQIVVQLSLYEPSVASVYINHQVQFRCLPVARVFMRNRSWKFKFKIGNKETIRNIV